MLIILHRRPLGPPCQSMLTTTPFLSPNCCKHPVELNIIELLLSPLEICCAFLVNIQCQDFFLLSPPSLERLLTVKLPRIVFWRVLNLWLVHPSPLDSQPLRWKGVLHRRAKKYLSESTLLSPVNIAAQLLMGVALGA